MIRIFATFSVACFALALAAAPLLARAATEPRRKRLGILAGLTREEVKKVKDKVPFLGDIPGVGRLFRSEGESNQKRNLLIFVTANLVSPGGSLKKQDVRGVTPNSLFQNPTIVTPASAEGRTRSGAK